MHQKPADNGMSSPSPKTQIVFFLKYPILTHKSWQHPSSPQQPLDDLLGECQRCWAEVRGKRVPKVPVPTAEELRPFCKLLSPAYLQWWVDEEMTEKNKALWWLWC